MNSLEQSESANRRSPASGLLGRDYTTRASAHGMAYLPLTPTEFSMTLEEAQSDVEFWKAYADTVGGDAIIVKRPNEPS